MSVRLPIILVAAFLCALPLRAASADPAALCQSAAATAARESGVPLPVLAAIALTETGRGRGGRLQPWPWTVNSEGRGAWFDSRDEALAHVAAERARGAASFDVGCFQINHRWHGAAFASVEEMFDPLAGARYAAQFLAGLQAELGSWSAAAGAYHSRTPDLAARYRTRFDRILAGLDPATMAQEALRLADLTAPAPPRANAFPLLRPAEAGAGGSLFPAGAPGARPLIGGGDG